jgi:hypothetical protein
MAAVKVYIGVVTDTFYVLLMQLSMREMFSLFLDKRLPVLYIKLRSSKKRLVPEALVHYSPIRQGLLLLQ